MSGIGATTVRELAAASPAAARVFERLGIDYCCGGNRSLEDACRAANRQLIEVQAMLQSEAARSAGAPDAQDWQRENLSKLIGHIVGKHHKYTGDEIGRLGPLFEKVCTKHSSVHPELQRMRTAFQGLAQELTLHMMKEEQVLFPFIARMEQSRLRRETITPAPFGSVQNPIAMMEHEHDSAANALRLMRDESRGYTAPQGACASFQALYSALQQFEVDLHQHIHLENNILFPRAAALERGV
jgi:regulator of cell morphogenesis and NO signaling